MIGKNNKLEIGMKAGLKMTATGQLINQIAEISGDYNPVHINDQYAQKSIFGKRIAHGLFCLGAVSNILGNVLPGEGTIIIEEDAKYYKPVYIDDEILTTVEITRLMEKGRVETRFECINQNKVKVMDGTVLVKVL